MKTKWILALVSILIIAIIIMFVMYEDNKNALIGIWLSTDEFNKISQASSIAISINANVKSGRIIIIGKDNVPVCNSEFDISLGIDRLTKKFKRSFKLNNCKFNYKSECLLPTNVKLILENDVLYLYSNTNELLAQCVKKLI